MYTIAYHNLPSQMTKQPHPDAITIQCSGKKCTPTAVTQTQHDMDHVKPVHKQQNKKKQCAAFMPTTFKENLMQKMRINNKALKSEPCSHGTCHEMSKSQMQGHILFFS